MGQIIINTEPTEIVLDGTTLLMKPDPTSGKAWADLMMVKTNYLDPVTSAESREKMLSALAEMADNPEAAQFFRDLDPERYGVKTVRLMATRYVEEVTGFPTQPSKRSTKG